LYRRGGWPGLTQLAHIIFGLAPQLAAAGGIVCGYRLVSVARPQLSAMLANQLAKFGYLTVWLACWPAGLTYHLAWPRQSADGWPRYQSAPSAAWRTFGNQSVFIWLIAWPESQPAVPMLSARWPIIFIYLAGGIRPSFIEPSGRYQSFILG